MSTVISATSSLLLQDAAMKMNGVNCPVTERLKIDTINNTHYIFLFAESVEQRNVVILMDEGAHSSQCGKNTNVTSISNYVTHLLSCLTIPQLKAGVLNFATITVSTAGLQRVQHQLQN